MSYTAVRYYLVGMYQVLACASVLAAADPLPGSPDWVHARHEPSSTQAPTQAPAQPDPALTPGAIDSHAPVAKLCTPGYTDSIRSVSRATKRAIIAEYRRKPGWPAPPYEVDHWIPLELGGLNAQANLWAQPLAEARRKDVVESRLHRMICKGQIELREAQTRIRTWWEEK